MSGNLFFPRVQHVGVGFRTSNLLVENIWNTLGNWYYLIHLFSFLIFLQSMWLIPWTRQFQGATQSVLTPCVQNFCKWSNFGISYYFDPILNAISLLCSSYIPFLPQKQDQFYLGKSSESLFGVCAACYSAFQGKEIGNEKLIGILDLQQISYKNIDPRGLITGFQSLQVNHFYMSFTFLMD